MTTDHDTPSAEAALAAAWQGFSTGYRVLTETELDVLCHKLLGHGPAAVADRAARELRSYTATVTAGPQPNRPPAVIMHSATRTTRGFDGDLADVRAGRDPYDVAGYLEARAVSLAAAGDLAVGRTQPWRDAVRHYGTDSLDVGLLEPYYLSDALLTVAAETPGYSCLWWSGCGTGLRLWCGCTRWTPRPRCSCSGSRRRPAWTL